jgi:hypothetical protein
MRGAPLTSSPFAVRSILLYPGREENIVKEQRVHTKIWSSHRTTSFEIQPLDGRRTDALTLKRGQGVSPPPMGEKVSGKKS